ncbi:MAG TPA: tetratricopeptide repeat protein [Candidatus Polarisedimenticolia bacterium]|jgi:tetratricopeptide (TPR) repeat protein|nr:tetratricopeptide repeat protein [Candidatus Polarisedimenticolia bacterium]
MPERRAESAFQKGVQAIARGDFLSALAYFEACMALQATSPGPLAVAAMSYYGLCLSCASDRLDDARHLCEAALEASPEDADLYLNLGRVCERQGEREHAFRTYVRGLRIHPRHPGLVEALRRLGFRRKPVLAFLPRGHAVNRVLGHLRAAVRPPRARTRRRAA